MIIDFCFFSQGNPGLLSEFFILPLNDGCFALESVVHRGTLVAIAETGKAKPINVDCEQTKFNVHVKVRAVVCIIFLMY